MPTVDELLAIRRSGQEADRATRRSVDDLLRLREAPAPRQGAASTDPRPGMRDLETRRNLARESLRVRGEAQDPLSVLAGSSPEELRAAHPSRTDVARAAGVGTEGAGAGPRFALNLALSAARGNPEDEIVLATSVLEDQLGVPVEVRQGPDTEALEFKPEGAREWTLINKPGMDLADFAAASPEALNLLGGAAGSLVGAGAGGLTGSPAAMFAGGVAGEGIGEGLVEFAKLRHARNQGVIDLSDEEIFDIAVRRAGLASATSAAGSLALRTFGRIIAGTFGFDPSAERAVGGAEALIEGRRAAEPVQREAQALTGERLPLTSGQTAGAPEALAGRSPRVGAEALKAEQVVAGRQGPGEAVRDVRAAQERTVRALEEEAFGPRDPEALVRGGEAVGGAVKAAQRRATGPAARREQAATEGLERTQRLIGGVARQPEGAMASARDAISRQREEVFAPFRQQFDELHSAEAPRINLVGFRRAARELEVSEGQGLLPSISIHAQSDLLRESQSAGQLNLPGGAVDRPVSLGEVQRALRDIRRELSRPSLADDRQRSRLLGQLRDQLETARNESLSPDELSRVIELENAYAEAAQRFDRGIVGEVMDTNVFGQPVLDGEVAMNRLLNSTRNAQEFVSAVTAMPNPRAVMRSVQEGILGRIDREFIDDETGELALPRLENFLRRNSETLELLFRDDPRRLGQITDARAFARAVRRARDQRQQISKNFKRRFGVYTADPAVVVSKLMRDGRAEDFQAARRLVAAHANHLLPVFDGAVAEQSRRLIVGAGGQGQVTPEGIQRFLESETGRIVGRTLGARYTRALTALRDALRLTEQRPADMTADDILVQLRQGVPGLQGVARFARVIFPPLSPSGRGLTATLGLVNERSQKRIARMLADPEAMEQLSKLMRISPTSEAGRAILGRIGMDHVLSMIDLSKVYPVEQE